LSATCPGVTATAPPVLTSDVLRRTETSPATLNAPIDLDALTPNALTP